MSTFSLFTERVDGVNGYIVVPAVNGAFFWRDNAGVLGTVPNADLAWVDGDNTWTGSNDFNSAITYGDDAAFSYIGGSAQAQRDALQLSDFYGLKSSENDWQDTQSIYIPDTTDSALILAAEDPNYSINGKLLRVIRQNDASEGEYFDIFSVDGSGDVVASGAISGSNLIGTNTGDQDLSAYALRDDDNEWTGYNQFDAEVAFTDNIVLQNGFDGSGNFSFGSQ